eukprot:m.115803 g.115803  ORF g.115803 m.115803 type:complete len:338 (+) comp37564_c1_seq2:12-1025(+)
MRMRHLLVLLSSAVFLCFADPHAALQRGVLLAGSMDYSIDVRMFSIASGGATKKLWNVTLSQAQHTDDALFNACFFAFDPTTQSIYVQSERYLEAIDAHTGNITQTRNNILAYFVTLFYDPTNRTMYGVCTGNNRFDWCEWQIEKNASRNSVPGTVKFLYGLDTVIEWGPMDCVGDYIPEERMFFYERESSVYAINTTNGQQIFYGVTNAGMCIKYDSIGGKLYGVASLNDLNTQYGLFVVIGDGKTEPKKVLDFPEGYSLNGVGSCEIAREDRALFVLMGDSHGPETDTAPKVLFGVDLVTMDVLKIPVPVFAEELKPYQYVDHMLYVPNSMWLTN